MTPGRPAPWLAPLLVALGALLLALAAPARSQDALREVHHIHGLAIDSRDPGVLYVATHTGLVRVGPDGALGWVGAHRFDLMGFTAPPGKPGLVYASGHPDLQTYRLDGVGNLGLLVSRDGGRSWQSVALKGQADFHAMAWSPRDGGQIYGWSVAGQAGLYRVSTLSWAVTRLPASGLSGALALAASPDPSGPLLAGTEQGLAISRDGGGAWARAAGAPADAPVTAVGFHSSDPRMVYGYFAGAGPGLMRSRDGGGKWEPAGLAVDPRTPVVAVAVGPGNHVAVATTAADVVRSRDGGRSWQTVLARGRPLAPGR